MSFKEHLRHLVPHVEWWGMEWLYHHYGAVLGSIMLTVLIAIVQKVRGVSYDWWVLGVLFLGSLILFVYFHRRERRQQVAIDQPSLVQIDLGAMERNDPSLALSRAWAASTVIDTGQVPAGIIFVVAQSYINYTLRENFPLKLHVIWANEGEEIHLGAPYWEVGKLSTQGRNLGQRLMYRYKVRLGKEETESEEVTAKHGQRGMLWLGLDPAVDIEQARLWKTGNQLGVLVLPVTVRNVTTEIRIRL
jgi:hypothetical protein